MPDIEDVILEKALAFARDRMSGLPPSHGWDHVSRVVNIAEKIAREESGADSFIVRTAALLHDIGRGDEIRASGKSCHAEIGSRMAYEFLIGQNLPEPRARHIRDCVLTHRYRDTRSPQSIEAKIVYDADKLDSIGAVGIGRAFLFAGEVGARLHNAEIDVRSTESYSYEDTAYREFTVKLRHVREKMLTSAGRRYAEERHAFMEEFFARLDREIYGDL